MSSSMLSRIHQIIPRGNNSTMMRTLTTVAMPMGFRLRKWPAAAYSKNYLADTTYTSKQQHDINKTNTLSSQKAMATNIRLINTTTSSTFGSSKYIRRSRSINNISSMEIPKPTHPTMMSMLTSTTSSLSTSSHHGDALLSNNLSSFHNASSCSFYSTVAKQRDSSSITTTRRQHTTNRAIGTPMLISKSSSSQGSTLSTKANLVQQPKLTSTNQFLGNGSSPTSIMSATPTTTTIRPKTNDTSMDDEYGDMSSNGETYTYPSPYHLESFGTFGHAGNTSTTQLPRGVLNPAFINYNTYGTLNAARDNVLVICHALTGNSSLEAWWGELLGSGKAFDTDQYFIVCCNILGSCYGSAGPSSKRPGFDDEEEGVVGVGTDRKIPRDKDGQAIYGLDFPDVSVRDTVRLQLLLLKHELKINSIKCVIGGSFGGMQTMEYCVMAGATRPVGGNGGSNGSGGMRATNIGGSMMGGDKNGIAYGIGEFVTKRNGRIEPFVRSAVPIACGAEHTAWQIGISETQRQAIYADPKWNNGRCDPHDPPNSGLNVARQVAMISYRTPLGYQQKFGRALTDESGPSYGSKAPWQVKSYLEYQGKKFLDRFDPVTYVKLTEQMDSHDVGRGRGSIEQVLSHVEIPVCVFGIDSDVLYPLREQEEMVQCMPNAELKIIHSDAGHDGFLLEQDQVSAHIKSFLYSHD